MSDASPQSAFLHAFIEAKAGSPAVVLDQVMRKQLTTNMSEALGGVAVKRAVRGFIAVLLKHLGLTAAAMQLVEVADSKSAPASASASAASAATNAPLLDVWKKGQAFHQWIVSTKQALQQAHAARVQADEEAGMCVCTPTFIPLLFAHISCRFE